MLSPDNFVQSPDFSQSFNRYSYAWNNPLVFTDPSGEIVFTIIGAIFAPVTGGASLALGIAMDVGGAINLGVKAAQGKINSVGDGLAAYGIGAAAGAVGYATGGAAFAAAGGAAGGAGGFLAGFAGGAVGSAYAMPIQSIGNSIYFGDPMMTGKQYLMGIAIGGLIGGTINGGIALGNGKTFLTGDIKGTGVPTSGSTPTLKFDEPEVKLNTDGMRSQLRDVVPDKGSVQYKAEYFSKISGSDGQHVWNRHTIEIVVDNGKVFPITGGDNNQYLLVQQIGKHHGSSGVFELVLDQGANVIVHQRFIPGGTITGVPNMVNGTGGSVSPAFPWWSSRGN
jgi:hypothetical protein